MSTKINIPSSKVDAAILEISKSAIVVDPLLSFKNVTHLMNIGTWCTLKLFPKIYLNHILTNECKSKHPLVVVGPGCGEINYDPTAEIGELRV